MTIRHLKIFLAVYEHNCNVTKAAEALHMSQPAVSLAIRELEDYYGVKLFERLGRRLTISEAGRSLLEYAVNISGLFHDMEDTMRDWDSTGKLRIGASITIGSQFLPFYVNAFNTRFPGTEVRVVVAPGEVIEERLLADELDFALVEGVPVNSSFQHEVYMEDRLAVICAPGRGYKNRQKITPAELCGMRLLLREKGSGTRDVFDSVLQSAGYTADPVWEAYSTTALYNAAINGLGIAVLPYRMVSRALREGRIIELVVDGMPFRRNFNLIWHRHKHLTKAARHFMDICRTYEMDYPMIRYNTLF